MKVHSLLPRFYWTDHVSNLSSLWHVWVNTNRYCEENKRTFTSILPQKEAKWQRYSGDSTNITDVFPDSDNLVELLISSKHLLPPSPLTGTGWWARHDNNNNNNSNTFISHKNASTGPQYWCWKCKVSNGFLHHFCYELLEGENTSSQYKYCTQQLTSGNQPNLAWPNLETLWKMVHLN